MTSKDPRALQITRHAHSIARTWCGARRESPIEWGPLLVDIGGIVTAQMGPCRGVAGSVE